MKRKETRFSTTSELWRRGGCHRDGVVPEMSFICLLSEAWIQCSLVPTASSEFCKLESCLLLQAVAISVCGLRAGDSSQPCSCCLGAALTLAGTEQAGCLWRKLSCRLCARTAPVDTSWHGCLRGSWSLSRIPGRRGLSRGSEGRHGLGALQGGPRWSYQAVRDDLPGVWSWGCPGAPWLSHFLLGEWRQILSIALWPWGASRLCSAMAALQNEKRRSQWCLDTGGQ